MRVAYCLLIDQDGGSIYIDPLLGAISRLTPSTMMKVRQPLLFLMTPIR